MYKMEESNKNSKTVELSLNTYKDKNNENSKKMSYEQLEQAAHQLSEQTRYLYDQLQKSNMSNMFKRLDYLFKVVENGHMFNSEFLNKCVEEIEDIITVPKDEEDSEPESKK